LSALPETDATGGLLASWTALALSQTTALTPCALPVFNPAKGTLDRQPVSFTPQPDVAPASMRSGSGKGPRSRTKKPTAHALRLAGGAHHRGISAETCGPQKLSAKAPVVKTL
jgi:hypothetical protein